MNKCVAITGCNGYIGGQTVLRFKDLGYHVIGVDRNTTAPWIRSTVDMFIPGDFTNPMFINSIIDKLVSDNVAPKYKLIQLFNLTEQNSKKEVFDKLNYQFTKTNTKPNRAQLLFVLLYNQYSNL